MASGQQPASTSGNASGAPTQTGTAATNTGAGGSSGGIVGSVQRGIEQLRDPETQVAVAAAIVVPGLPVVSSIAMLHFTGAGSGTGSGGSGC